MNDRFLIFADTRTGSSCLFNIMARTYDLQFKPDAIASKRRVIVTGISEPFHPNVVSYFYKEEVYEALYPSEPKFEGDPIKWKDEGCLLKEDWPTIKRIFDKSFEFTYGIKHIWSHLKREDNYRILNRAIENKYKIILLNREGVIKKCLSHLICEQKNIWRARERRDLKFEKVDLKRLNQFAKDYIKQLTEYKDFLSPHDHYSLSYEDFLVPEETEERLKKVYDVLEYCEIERENIPCEMCRYLLGENRKMNPNEILQLIPNFKEIKELAKNEYNEIL